MSRQWASYYNRNCWRSRISKQQEFLSFPLAALIAGARLPLLCAHSPFDAPGGGLRASSGALQETPRTPTPAPQYRGGMYIPRPLRDARPPSPSIAVVSPISSDASPLIQAIREPDRDWRMRASFRTMDGSTGS